MRVLVLEDAPRIAAFLEKGLREEGHAVSVCGDLPEARRTVELESFDAAVVDRILPGGDGLDLVRELRERGDELPVLVLTARDLVQDRVEGLRSGADDYLVKPFAFDELLARLETIAGRGRRREERLVVGELHVDLASRRVTRSGRPVHLTPREFALLVALARNAGRAMSRARLLEEVWGTAGDPASNLVDVYVRYVRAKLGPGLVHTVRGVGYVLEERGP